MTDERKKTVLVVDDDIDFIDMHRLHLESAGFDVLTAESRKEAEAIIADTRPDLAVIDLMMEEMDGGFVLAHHLKKRYPDVPIIMVTSVTSETGLEFDEGTGHGDSWLKADAIFAKPVRYEQLRRTINRLLDISL